MVKKDSGNLICCLRTDRGGEFTSKDFNQFCSDHGIARQLTASYTPQQNGVAKRKNCTLMNMVRSMLSGKNMPKKFLPDVVNWAIHILNHSSTLAVKDKTPEEAWSNIKSSVDYFRTFGCIAYAHISNARKTKLDDKSMKCVLLGISAESKAYKLYNPTTKMEIISRDLVFAEDEIWNQEQSETVQKSDILEWESDEPANHKEGNKEIEESTDEEDEACPTQERIVRSQCRIICEPAWKSDYIIGEDLSESEEDQNMMMVITAGDPTSFEEATKKLHLKEALKQEIQAIEENKTWELVTLPRNAKKRGSKMGIQDQVQREG